MIDVAIIGAGPAGSVAASLLVQKGWKVEVFEHAHFPRFSIGESLLPQAMEWLEEAGLLRDVVEAGFQHKNGAIFQWGERQESFDFREKSSAGWGTTFQVRRAEFDQILANAAIRFGAKISFGCRVKNMLARVDHPRLTIEDEAGCTREIESRFVLDASGFGRVLARLLDLERPTDVPKRIALFRHVKDNISPHTYDRDKILISINPRDPAIWYWMIPLAGGVTSVGVVGEPARLGSGNADTLERFDSLIKESGLMGRLIAGATPATDLGRIEGYACKVKSLTGSGFAMLGNAGEFLDPIFSSGVTIALKSASLAAKITDRYLSGAVVDWEAEFSRPLMRGVNTFRAYVNAWYSGELQRIIFHHPEDTGNVKSMITAVLAGYAWDETNSLVRRPTESLERLASLCA
jgi:flavin-dependent dehydrogenase